MIVKRHAGLLQPFMRRHAQSRRPFLLIAFLVGEDEEDVGSGAHWTTGPSRLGARSLRTRGLEGSGPKCRCRDNSGEVTPRRTVPVGEPTITHVPSSNRHADPPPLTIRLP